MSVRRYSLNFATRPAPRGRDGKELIQCPTSSCDGMGHVSGNYATHRRQGSISTFTPRLWRERSIMYISIWRCSTHARTLHTYTYIHIPLRIHSPHMTHTYAHMFLNLCWPSFWSPPPHDKASSSHLLRPRARKNDDIFLEIIILHVHTRRHSSKFASYIYMDGFSCIDAYWWSVA